ncbi:MAG: 30S ribosomal protein S17 [Gammaproteobacteria bacterium]
MSETMDAGTDNTDNATAKRRLVARVVSTRMDKSASVEITRMVRHAVYGKYLRRRTKLLVHDEANECRTGDLVAISSCRPLSKRKAWRVVEIVERAAGESPEANETDRASADTTEETAA